MRGSGGEGGRIKGGEVSATKAGTQIVPVRHEHRAFRGTTLNLCFLLLASEDGTDPQFKLRQHTRAPVA